MTFKSVALVLIGGLLLASGLYPVVAAELRVSELPKEFKGTYVWRDNGQEYPVVLKIDRAEEKDGKIRFTGKHHYLRGNTTMKVEGQIDPRSRALTFTEREAGGDYVAHAETEGAFTGTVSSDLKTWEAEWTTRDTGRKGDLALKASK